MRRMLTRPQYLSTVGAKGKGRHWPGVVSKFGMTVELSDKILKQVEFYFGDANLPRDKFLLGKVQESDAGWVSIETIASFSRMKSLTEDFETIKSALKKDSSVVELNEDGSLVRRKVPLPEPTETLSKTVYVKGFPLEATLDQVLEFFSSHAKGVQAVRFRRDIPTRAFKGSVWMEFATKEDAEEFISSAAANPISYEGNTLIVKSKMQYMEDKSGDKSVKNNHKSVLDTFGRNRLVKILSVPSEGLTYNNLKEALKESSFEVAFVDLTYETGCAFIRLKESVASEFVAKFNAENPLVVGEIKLTEFEAATEEEQTKYFEHVQKSQSSNGGNGRRNNKRSNFRNNNNRGSRNKKAKEEAEN